MTRVNRRMTEKNLDLIFEFERYVLAHPGFAAKIPAGAVVVLQIKGDDKFNQWSRRIGETQVRAERRPIVHVTIGKLGPVRSRIEALRIERAA